MSEKNEKMIVCSVMLVVILTQATLMAVPAAASSLGSDLRDAALRFMEKVAGINLSAYRVNGLISMFDLRGEAGNISVGFDFVNGKITWCNLGMLSGPSYTDVHYVSTLPPAKNVIDAVKGYLERYRANFDAPYVDGLPALLDGVNTQKWTQSIADDYASLEVIDTEDTVSFIWYMKADGMEARIAGVAVTVTKKGFLNHFADTWGVCKVGSTTVKVSRDEAINMALAKARERFRDENPNITKVEAKLMLDSEEGQGSRGNRYTLYPRWSVIITFDKIYSMGIFGYAVRIWADTGELYWAAPQGVAGYPGSYTRPQTDDWSLTLVIGSFVAATAITTTVAIFNRKGKPKRRGFHAKP